MCICKPDSPLQSATELSRRKQSDWPETKEKLRDSQPADTEEEIYEDNQRPIEHGIQG